LTVRWRHDITAAELINLRKNTLRMLLFSTVTEIILQSDTHKHSLYIPILKLN